MLEQLRGIHLDTGSRQHQFLSGIDFPLVRFLGDPLRNISLDSIPSAEHDFLDTGILQDPLQDLLILTAGRFETDAHVVVSGLPDTVEKAQRIVIPLA